MVYQNENINLDGRYQATIDLSGQANGIYYVQVNGNQSNYFRKIVLQK